MLFLGDVFSTGYFAIEKCDVIPGDSVVIFGAGPVGLCAVQAAKLFSAAQIMLVDVDSFRLETGIRMGATHTIRADQDDVLARIGEITKGRGAEASVEAAGLEVTLQQSVRCVGLGGRVTLVGLFPGEVSLPLNEVLMKNIRIEMGLSDLSRIRRFMTLVESSQIDLTPLITHRMKLSEAEDAFDMFENRQDHMIKVALQP